MINAAWAGLLYFAAIFAIGFLLGTVRVLFLEPSIGALGATLTELPIILLAAWYLCRLILRKVLMSETVMARAIMGIVAFTFLLLAEQALALLMFERSLIDQLAHYQSIAGAIGLIGQIIFGALPLLVVVSQNRKS